MEIALTVVSKIIDCFIVAGVAWPYIPQARMMWNTKNANAFSLLASFVVIVSATMRVFFWFGRHYEVTLLVQAICSIIAQLSMVWVVVTIKAHNNPTPKVKHRTISDLDWRTFWAWDDYYSYLNFEFVLVMGLMLFQVACGSFAWYVESLGTLSLGIEALLPLPQAIKNFQNKSTAGLSSVMILSWVAGDAFKTIYAIAKQQPLQFIMCGLFQVSVDIVLFLQLYVCDLLLYA
jgi:uncharacterized protein with PQ loop repeat